MPRAHPPLPGPILVLTARPLRSAGSAGGIAGDRLRASAGAAVRNLAADEGFRALFQPEWVERIVAFLDWQAVRPRIIIIEGPTCGIGTNHHSTWCNTAYTAAIPCAS